MSERIRYRVYTLGSAVCPRDVEVSLMGNSFVFSTCTAVPSVIYRSVRRHGRPSRSRSKARYSRKKSVKKLVGFQSNAN